MTCLVSQLRSKVTVTYCSFYIKCSVFNVQCPHCYLTIFKPATPLTNGVINEMLHSLLHSVTFHKVV